MALSKPRPILQDMPPHIKEKIFNNLDFFVHKVSLQKAFPEFRRVFGTPEYPSKTVQLTCSDEPNRIRLGASGDFEHFIMNYTQSENGTTMRHFIFCGPDFERFIPETDRNHIDLLVQMFECLVDNPKFKLNCLTIDSCLLSANTEQIAQNGQVLMENLGNMLKNLKCQIKVKSFQIDCFGKQDNVLKILPYIDPNHLKNLKLVHTDELIDEVDELMESEHWKKIEHLGMFDLPDNKFPIENWWNFPKTEMKLRYTSMKEIKRLVQHFRRSKTFVSCSLETNFRKEQLKDALGKNRVLVSHPNSYYESYMEFPATETLKRVFVQFPNTNGTYVNIAIELEREELSDLMRED